MKLNRRNTISCSLRNAEVAAFEQWGTAMNLNTNQAIKKCIAFTIKNLKPPTPVVEPVEPLEAV